MQLFFATNKLENLILLDQKIPIGARNHVQKKA